MSVRPEDLPDLPKSRAEMSAKFLATVYASVAKVVPAGVREWPVARQQTSLSYCRLLNTLHAWECERATPDQIMHACEDVYNDWCAAAHVYRSIASLAIQLEKLDDAASDALRLFA